MHRDLPSIAIIGGGITGLTAAWQLAQNGGVDITLFEAGPRLGGTLETIHRDGFTIECGPEGMVTEKPWGRAAAEDLGLGPELMTSNDDQRINYVLREGRLVAIPGRMRMMVPTSLESLEGSSFFTEQARKAYAAEPGRAAELLASVPAHDESIASFVLRHFGQEVLDRVAGPLLSGIFGGDVYQLSARAAMPAFVAMEREYGSLIVALQARAQENLAAGCRPVPVFTTLRRGLGSLTDRMIDAIPPASIRLNTPVTALRRDSGQTQWVVETSHASQPFDAVMICAPAHAARALVAPLDPRMAELMEMETSSSTVVSLAFREHFDLPPGFGFLVPEDEASPLLACTFVDQKFDHRAPPGCRLLRAFFGDSSARQITALPDSFIAGRALAELEKILGPLPRPAFSVVRRWPRSLPQYAVGHLDRMAELGLRTQAHPNLWLLGNAYFGVGLPDLIREARAAANVIVSDLLTLPANSVL